MSSQISRRHLLSTSLAAVGGTSAAGAVAAEGDKAPAKKGRLTLDGLGKLLAAMGLKVTKEKSQYNFTFPAKLDEEWNMTMSAVLSTDEESIWIMAWLNELPKSAAYVPRTALLRLLAKTTRWARPSSLTCPARSNSFTNVSTTTRTTRPSRSRTTCSIWRVSSPKRSRSGRCLNGSRPVRGPATRPGTARGPTTRRRC